MGHAIPLEDMAAGDGTIVVADETEEETDKRLEEMMGHFVTTKAKSMKKRPAAAVAEPKTLACKKRPARAVTVDDIPAFPGTKQAAPIYWKASIIYFSEQGKQWRVKAKTSDRLDKAFSFKVRPAREVWDGVCDYLKRVNP
eukprot:9653127-Karenia_brevis.AAC.1